MLPPQKPQGQEGGDAGPRPPAGGEALGPWDWGAEEPRGLGARWRPAGPLKL